MLPLHGVYSPANATRLAPRTGERGRNVRVLLASLRRRRRRGTGAPRLAAEPRARSRMPDPGKTAAIILAAGKSERMKSPKPLLIFGKETAVDRLIRVCTEAGCDT